MTDLLGISEKCGSSQVWDVWSWWPTGKRTSGAKPARKLRMELMRPVLVYRIQEKAFGLAGPKRKGSVPNLLASSNQPRFKSGTKIIREWKGQLHEVSVATEGYLYKGDLYKSLSPIAFRITGTKWSGPAFFGTKTKEGRG